jgi:hypothetical protein
MIVTGIWEEVVVACFKVGQLSRFLPREIFVMITCHRPRFEPDNFQIQNSSASSDTQTFDKNVYGFSFDPTYAFMASLL